MTTTHHPGNQAQHAPKPTVDTTATHVLIKCQRGHLLASTRVCDWAGSSLEVRAGRPWACGDCS